MDRDLSASLVPPYMALIREFPSSKPLEETENTSDALVHVVLQYVYRLEHEPDRYTWMSPNCHDVCFNNNNNNSALAGSVLQGSAYYCYSCCSSISAAAAISVSVSTAAIPAQYQHQQQPEQRQDMNDPFASLATTTVESGDIASAGTRTAGLSSDSSNKNNNTTTIYVFFV
eukprot:scaffold3453_cov73-Cylindrotheca_fusiformis.AAC.1